MREGQFIFAASGECPRRQACGISSHTRNVSPLLLRGGAGYVDLTVITTKESNMTLRRALGGGMVLIVLAAVAVVAGWWFFIREDNELATNAPEIPSDLVSGTSTSDRETPSDGATPAASAGGNAFTIISERSEAAYFADEKLASLPLPSKAKGSTKDITGTFYLTEDGLDLDTSRESTFTVDLRTITSDRDMRDRRVQNDGLQTSQFPTATFTATSVSGYDASIPEGEEQTLQLTGMMDLHGVQKGITWDVKARRDGNVITALATVSFLYADFNIPVLNIAGFVSVEDDVTLQVQIVAQAGEEAT
jgi:polyisoprenoid-binding protein YceI